MGGGGGEQEIRIGNKQNLLIRGGGLDQEFGSSGISSEGVQSLTQGNLY